MQEQEYQQDASVSPVIPQEYLPSSGYGYPVEEGQGMSSYTGMPAYDMGVAYNQAGAHSTYASPSPDPYAQQRMRRVGPSPPLDSFPTPPPSHGMAMGMPTEPYSAYDPYGQAPPEQYGSHPGYYQGQGGAGYPKPSPPGHATPPDMSYRQHQSMRCVLWESSVIFADFASPSFSCYCDYSRGYVCEQHRH